MSAHRDSFATSSDGSEGERIADVGEDGLVAQVVSQYPPAPSWLRVGPGDDAAVLALGGAAAHGLVASTDTMVQGRDFRLDWSTGFDVGVKLAAQNLADIAAMGAEPKALLVSLAAPHTVPVDFARELAAGLADECGRCGAAVVGGDVSDATEVVLSGTALGLLPEGVRAVQRSGANPGEVVALAGVCGPSAAGLDLLRAGSDGDCPVDVQDPALLRLLAAHRAPRPTYAAGVAAAMAGATAMIDISDGLVRDATRVARASGVTLAIEAQRLPQDPDLALAATRLGRADAVRDWQLSGGEDHALLACFPADVALPPSFVLIGAVLTQGADPMLVDGRAPTVQGWQHWS